MSIDFDKLSESLKDDFTSEVEGKELEDNGEVEETEVEPTNDKVKEDSTNPENTEEEVEEEEEEEEVVSEDDVNDLEEVEAKPIKPKYSRAEKERYAFEKLRKENKELKAKEAELDRIAQTYGYKNNAEMLAALKEDALRKEAQKKGYDPELYRKVIETETELERIKREREEEVKKAKITNFVNTLDNFAKSNKLTEDDKLDIINALENDGYTIDDLIAVKNPEALIKGYAVDKLKERIRQEELMKLNKKKKFEEGKFSRDPEIPDVADLDAMLSEYFKNKT